MYNVYVITQNDLQLVSQHDNKTSVLQELNIVDFNYKSHADFQDMAKRQVHSTETKIVFKD